MSDQEAGWPLSKADLDRLEEMLKNHGGVYDMNAAMLITQARVAITLTNVGATFAAS